MGAEVVAISTDTEFTHLAWQKHEKLLEKVNYPMGADPTGNLCKMFGIYDEETGLPLRGAFIINPEGVLLNTEINYYNMGRNIDELMRKFKANIHLSRNKQEACPSKWKEEGNKTLLPSAKMVGKVFEALQ
jgi:peroxiredoxin (alkyl hydroperoxide reductase subunit C)